MTSEAEAPFLDRRPAWFCGFTRPSHRTKPRLGGFAPVRRRNPQNDAASFCRSAVEGPLTPRSPPAAHRMSIASPKDRKRYRSSIAWAYASMICSRVAKALTSIMSVDRGTWKFVTSASTTW